MAVTYPPGAYRFQDDFYSVRPEPRKLCGAVFLQQPDGSVTLQKGAELPAGAVRDNRVIVYVDGIHQSFPEQQRQIRELMSDLGQPVVGVHEGSGTTILHDSRRQAKNLVYLKSLQNDLEDAHSLRSRVFHNDPAVKSVFNLLRQGLDAGRDITLVTHSGGGIEAALALHMLADKGYTEKIESQLRVLSLASGVSPEDFQTAGVKSEHLYYTGSDADLAFQLARHFLPVAVPGALGGALSWLLERPADEVLAHSPDYLFEANGKTALENFMTGRSPGRFVEVP